MKVKVSLNGTGGELDNRTVEVESEDSGAIKEAAEEMLAEVEYLSVGDSITVTELAA